MPTDHENDARLKRLEEDRKAAEQAKQASPPKKPAPSVPDQSELFI